MSFFKLKCFSPGRFCSVADRFIPEQNWDMIVNEDEISTIKKTHASSCTEGADGSQVITEHQVLLVELKSNKSYFVLGTIDEFWDVVKYT